MRLPPPYLITESKLTGYLLKFRDQDDKSNYLGQAGYTLDNWELLLADLLRLVETNDAVLDKPSVYGQSYQVIGELTGPTGRKLSVKTIWMLDIDEEKTKFITLYPNK
ncbi:DUF6883 domain-containing protein [Arsenicibacter rosenii]|uniref:DUF6883 domain-containing protein n=1 Tax=Arsenicibacter rosenii TaxID=1750698 RepID=A0A1S2VF36_9BACT|nr:DUF6883 domain-containing protein [Arsenicibacter rosenii]OIN56816.1 hypothetical protein BLX24_22850 [Arsenicibacter rosenii]